MEPYNNLDAASLSETRIVPSLPSTARLDQRQRADACTPAPYTSRSSSSHSYGRPITRHRTSPTNSYLCEPLHRRPAVSSPEVPFCECVKASAALALVFSSAGSSVTYIDASSPRVPANPWKDITNATPSPTKCHEGADDSRRACANLSTSSRLAYAIRCSRNDFPSSQHYRLQADGVDASHQKYGVMERPCTEVCPTWPSLLLVLLMIITRWHREEVHHVG